MRDPRSKTGRNRSRASKSERGTTESFTSQPVQVFSSDANSFQHQGQARVGSSRSKRPSKGSRIGSPSTGSGGSNAIPVSGMPHIGHRRVPSRTCVSHFGHRLFSGIAHDAIKLPL